LNIRLREDVVEVIMITRAKKILEQYNDFDNGEDEDDFDPNDQAAFLRANREEERRQRPRISRSPLARPRSYRDLTDPQENTISPEDQASQEYYQLSQQQQMAMVSPLAMSMSFQGAEFDRYMREIKDREKKKRILKAVGAGAFWTAAIIAAPLLGSGLLAARLYQRGKFSRGGFSGYRQKMQQTGPRWV